MKEIKQWKLRNQTTKYTISGKTNSSTIKKANVLQNLYPLKKQSYREKSNTLHFPNTMLGRLEPLAKDKDMHKASSSSIQLSRKYNMSQMKRSQMKDEDKLIVVPKIEAPISDVKIKPQIISMPSDTFYNITDSVSTTSTLSVSSSFKMEHKRTFANIGNREKSISKVTSRHLYPTNSEYEINVLHYENDILSESKSAHFAASSLNSDADWHFVEDTNSAKIEDNKGYMNDKQNVLESHQKSNASKPVRNTKYSWETLDGWTPSPRRREYDHLRGQRYLEMCHGKPYDCRIKYSWQVIGTGTQTSYSLLQDLLNNTEDRESQYKLCSIKYSWQIIGTGTQASLHDCDDPDYWRGILLTPNKNYKSGSQIADDERDGQLRNRAKCPERRMKRCLILNNQQTQTFAERDVQADVNDYYYAKYSWHNLIKRCL